MIADFLVAPRSALSLTGTGVTWIRDAFGAEVRLPVQSLLALPGRHGYWHQGAAVCAPRWLKTADCSSPIQHRSGSGAGLS